ncbi:MAG: tetratricopeptide repeat protein [Luteolibacter sp.]
MIALPHITLLWDKRIFSPVQLVWLVLMPVFPLSAADGGAGRDSRIADWIRDLSDENFRVREQASHGLWSQGEPAKAALDQALKSSEPERVVRAREILRKIELEITPDTDAGIVQWIEQYATASAAEKLALMSKLQGKKAWRQMLKLFARETDGELRAKLESSINTVAIGGARAHLLHGEFDAARGLLELAPANRANLLALAEFHRSQGTIDNEIRRAEKRKDASAAQWRHLLWRAKGNASAARKEALAVGDSRAAALMAMLLGDPEPWLQLLIADDEASGLLRSYASAALSHWRGGLADRKEIVALEKYAKSRDGRLQGTAINAMFLLGEAKLALPYFSKAQALSAFAHLDAMEQLPEALELLGINVQNPDFRGWVDEKLGPLLREEIDDDDFTQNEAEFLVLANFLERRGLDDAAYAAIAEPMLDVAEVDRNMFWNCLAKFLVEQGGAPRLGRKIAIEWAGEDGERWDELSMAVFSDNEHADAWWSWLGEFKPALTQAECFDALLTLFKVLPDRERQRDAWIDRLWQSIAELNPQVRQQRIRMMAEVFAECGDATHALMAWDEADPETRTQIYWGQILVHLAAMNRWDDAAALVCNQLESLSDSGHPASADLYAYAAAAFRAAGDEAKAVHYDKLADHLSLGDPAVAVRIGNAYSYGCDYPRASLWWRRAVMLSDERGDSLALALRFHSDAMLFEDKWSELAAVSEVLASMYADTQYLIGNQVPFIRLRLQSDTARALTRLKSDPEAALALLTRCHQTCMTDGSLADFFFPALRQAGLTRLHDQWFDESWNHLSQVLARYPDSENTLNTAAWFATRAMRNLDEALRMLNKALAMNPNQAAYLDTMAEYHFAKGRREEALKWSGMALDASPMDTLIRRQQERFRSAPFPQ